MVVLTSSSACFTGLWNYLDCPATIVPVGKVQDSDIASAAHGPRYGSQDEEMSRLCEYIYHHRWSWGLSFADTGPTAFRDAPAAIQIIGKRQHDEELLALTSLVDAVLKS